jgi:predicted RNase H-like nuclease (RuvC/YqgF family)
VDEIEEVAESVPSPALAVSEKEPVAEEAPQLPVVESQFEQEPTTEEEPVVEDETVVDIETVLNETQTPVESGEEAPVAFEPLVEVAPSPEADPEQAPESAPRSGETGGFTEIESELGSLQETARRADELAGNVERRINELKSADERSVQLEADLDVSQRRVEELEERISGVDTLADELRATTAKLEEVNRVLEGSVG